MTKKLAVFVEGQTEAIFIRRLVEEIAGARNIQVETVALAGKGFLYRPRPEEAGGSKFYVLIVDCGNDERVKTVILDNRESLERSGYSLVLGLRDLYPTPLGDLAKVKRFLAYGVPTKGVPTQVLLAVAEVEAWFIQEYTHFERVHPGLNASSVLAVSGFDPVTACAEDLPAPAEVLHQVYGLVGYGYRKRRNQVERTVMALDCAELCLGREGKIPHFKEFFRVLDGFFEQETLLCS